MFNTRYIMPLFLTSDIVLTSAVLAIIEAQGYTVDAADEQLRLLHAAGELTVTGMTTCLGTRYTHLMLDSTPGLTH